MNINSTDALKLQMTDIDEKIKVIKAELVGEVKRKVYYITINLDPRVYQETIDLLSLSSTHGITSIGTKEDLATLSKEIKAEDPQKVKDFKRLQLSLRSLIIPQVIDWNNLSDQTTITAQQAEKNKDSGGQNQSSRSLQDSASNNDLPHAFLYYNIPGKYELSLSFGGKPIPTYTSREQKEGSDNYSIYFPQLGITGSLPVDFKDATIVYYEDTGALKSARFVKASEDYAGRIQAGADVADSLKNVIKAIQEKNISEDVIKEEVEEQVVRLIIEQATPPANL